MYKLKIYIDSDGDFYYENPLYKADDCEHEFYYSHRADAVKDFKDVIRKLAETIYTSRDYLKDIEDIVRKFEPIAYKIADKLDTFFIEFDFGNQEMEFSIVKTSEVKTSSRCYFEDEDADAYLWGCQNINNYDWGMLDRLPDIV